MDDNKLLVIGAGVAGLATGVYARLNGYDVELFEKHNLPGGMCTSWQRKGYTFDYCMHNLIGTGSSSDVHDVWGELGALDGVQIHDSDSFVRIEGPGGEHLEWYTDLQRLEEHLNELAPQDERAIAELLKGARGFLGVDPFSAPLGGFWRMLKLMTRMPAIKRASNTKLAEFSPRFSHPFLRRAFEHVQYDLPAEDVPLLALLVFMAGLHKKDLGWPHGGSLAFSKRIAHRLSELGGRIHFKSRVDQIMLENNRAIGVRLADGTEHSAGRVVSAADGYDAIFRMLGGRYLSDDIKAYYTQDETEVVPFGLVIYYGLSGHMPAEAFAHSHALTLLFDKPLKLGESALDSLHLVAYGPDSGLVDEGHWILKVETQASYGHWKKLRDKDRAAYKELKQEVAQVVLDRLDSRFAGISQNVEVTDVTTLATCERYTGNRFGYQPAPPKQNADRIMRQGLSLTLPGLSRFHMVSHWATANVGVSTVALNARKLVKKLCKQDGRPFKTKP